MTEVQWESIFPASREKLWRLLNAHLDPTSIVRIHPEILSQRNVSSAGGESVVDRTIDMRGKHVASRWKIVYRPPATARWEIVAGDGPWMTGNWIENQYSDAPNGVLVRTRGDLRVVGLPGLFQRRIINRVFDTIDLQDTTFVSTLP